MASTAIIPTYTSRAACRRLKRGRTWRVQRRDCLCEQRRRPCDERQRARRDLAQIFSRTGISSSDTSLVKMASRAANRGSELTSPSWIESKACRSHALRVITTPLPARRGLDPQKPHGDDRSPAGQNLQTSHNGQPVGSAVPGAEEPPACGEGGLRWLARQGTCGSGGSGEHPTSAAGSGGSGEQPGCPSGSGGSGDGC
jgi:hypothetical protein